MESLRLAIKALVPSRYRPLVKATFYFGWKVKCPCCDGHFRKFLPLFGRPNAMCPKCGAMERHRLIWLYLKNKTNFFSDNICFLHFAPEEMFSRKFSSLPNIRYVSADLDSPMAMIKMDITNIPCKDETFDALLCCHLLEHVPDDLKAMRELFRILKQGGWAFLQHPIDQRRDKTFEDLNIMTPEERNRVFGQADHVRIYGKDLRYRLEKAGFSVNIENYVSQFNPAMINRYGLKKDEQIYLCVKN